MRTLLRRIEGRTYFKSPGCWSADPEKARDFHSMLEAVEFVERAGYRNMEIAFLFDNPRRLDSVRVDTRVGIEA